MKTVLAIESSRDTCLVVLSYQGNIIERIVQGARSHTENLLPFIGSVLQEAGIEPCEIDLFAFSAGPGSFTGIRLAASAMKTLAYTAKKPVIALSSLQLLAQSYFLINNDCSVVQVINDARMNGLYVGHYQRGGSACKALSQDQLVSLDTFAPIKEAFLIGDAGGLLGELHLVSSVDVIATALIDCALVADQEGKAQHALTVEPVYLRDKTSWKTVEQQKQMKAR